MRIAVTGATGFLGIPLVERLVARGDRVLALSRDPQRVRSLLPAAAEPAKADLASGVLDPALLEGVDGVVHLAAESVNRRWNAAGMRAIAESRSLGTAAVVRAVSAAPTPPRVLVSASAVGFYGDRGDELLDESSPAGTGFLAEVARDWEAPVASLPASVRAVRARIGIVLHPAGGALAALLPIFRAAAGGPAGSGRQWMSWIHRDDLLSLVLFALDRELLSGPVNAVAPNPVRNADFATSLGRALHRPALAPAPAPILRLALGGRASLVLDSQRVTPKAALAAGFPFAFPELDGALADLFRRREG